jgi:hypothetical protein
MMRRMSRVRTIGEAVARLEALDRALPRADGVRWFNRLYLEVTVAVRRQLREQPLEAPPFLEQLDIYFADAYFAALDAAERGDRAVARAWAPLLELRHERGIAPLQFALAGLNAHINHDLANGVVATCETLGMRPGAPQRHDYDSINAVLRETEGRVKQWLLTDALKEIDQVVAPADDLAAIWSVTRARDAAWVRAQVLWRLRDEPELRDAYLAVNDRATELAGRAFLLPLP